MDRNRERGTKQSSLQSIVSIVNAGARSTEIMLTSPERFIAVPNPVVTRNTISTDAREKHRAFVLILQATSLLLESRQSRDRIFKFRSKQFYFPIFGILRSILPVNLNCDKRNLRKS